MESVAWTRGSVDVMSVVAVLGVWARRAISGVLRLHAGIRMSHPPSGRGIGIRAATLTQRSGSVRTGQEASTQTDVLYSLTRQLAVFDTRTWWHSRDDAARAPSRPDCCCLASPAPPRCQSSTHRIPTAYPPPSRSTCTSNRSLVVPAAPLPPPAVPPGHRLQLPRHVAPLCQLHQPPLLSDHPAPHCACAQTRPLPNPLYRCVHCCLLPPCLPHHLRRRQCPCCRCLLLRLQRQYRVGAQHHRRESAQDVPATRHLLLSHRHEFGLHQHRGRGGALVLVREDAAHAW